MFLCLFNLLAGNGAFTYLIMLAPIRRGWLDLIPFSFTLFGYWVLISVAAYRGALAAHPQSVLLGKDPARRVAARGGATARRRTARHEVAPLTRALAAAPIASLAFVAILALAAIAVRHGLIADDALRLWAGASTAADGQVPIGRIVAAYPTLPFLATTLVAWLAPAGTPAPALVAAGLFALIAAFCFLSFRKAGLPMPSPALFTTLLIAFHPALLRAVVAGPADMFLAAFLLMLCLALYDLRARSGTSEVMGVGLALMALAFSHPMGAAFAFAAVPFLAFAVRPMLVANSALNVVVALIFPTFFAVAAFSYVSWIFPGDGWSFFAAPAESLSLWTAAVARAVRRRSCRVSGARREPGDGGWRSPSARRVAVVMLALVYRRRPLVMPAVVFAATVIAATAISVLSGFFGDPTAIVVAAPVLAAAVVIRVPVARERLRPRHRVARARMARRLRKSRARRSGHREHLRAAFERGGERAPRRARRRRRRRSDTTACWPTSTTRPPSCSAAAARAEFSARRAKPFALAMLLPASTRRSSRCRIRKARPAPTIGSTKRFRRCSATGRRVIASYTKTILGDCLRV